MYRKIIAVAKSFDPEDLESRTTVVMCFIESESEITLKAFNAKLPDIDIYIADEVPDEDYNKNLEYWEGISKPKEDEPKEE
jgi:hypothetical protein